MIDPALHGSKILIVDDQINSVYLLQGFLEKIGFFNVRHVTDSTLVFSEIERDPPDLIVLDLNMPNVDGYSVLEYLRPRIKDETAPPILVVTGDTSRETKRKALIAGANDILHKPFDPSELSLRILNLLETYLLKKKVRNQNELLSREVSDRTRELEQALEQLKRTQGQMLQQERLRAFTEMAAGVVHDFNNALMSIIGYSDLLIRDPELVKDPERVLEYVGIMNTAGRDASSILLRLRDFYRPRDESDAAESVDLNTVLEEVVALTQPKWKDQALADGRTINVQLDLERVPAIAANASELRGLFTNLVFNAVDAMPAGGEIILRTRRRDSFVLAEVCDAGIGMSAETRQRCLEPFFTTKGEQGTGLGLAMVFGTIKRHEGTIEIESTPERGTTVRMQFPGADARAAQEESKPLDRSLRVLVVDDERVPCDILEKYLIADGHKVVTLSDGSAALKRIKSESFDLLITDYAMPGMTGTELAAVVRTLRPAMPIVVVTGFNIGTIPPLQRDNVSAIMAKPIEHADLRRTLQTLFAPLECAAAA